MSLFSIIAIAVAIPLGIAFSAFVWFFFRLRIQPQADHDNHASQHQNAGANELPEYQPLASYLSTNNPSFAVEYAPIEGKLNEAVS